MSKKEPEPQSISAKKSESQRPHHGKAILESSKLRTMFCDRANAILEDLKNLDKKRVSFSPFLEIGAGSVQRSAALINNFSVQGVATDISQMSLQDTPYILAMLGYKHSPLLISCDAHTIPFLENSFQFVFAYQTLHHFENPVPVFAECYRVLAKNGHLFFNEEPMDSSFRRLLRGKRLLSTPPTGLQKIGFRLGVEKLFWDDGALERSLGITEARFDLDLWRKALEPFKIIDIEVNRKLKIHSNLYKPILKSIFSGFIGGNVKGLCQKMEGEYVSDNFYERLMCVDCGSTKFSQNQGLGIICGKCKRQYPLTDGVIRMLPEQLEAELYPKAAIEL